MFIAHLSDPHLVVGPLGATPAQRLHLALGRVLALDPQPDCVVITGDVADHARIEEYAAVRALIGSFPLPLHLVAGNHDDSETMVTAFAGTSFMPGPTYVVDYPRASVIVLDSSIPGRVGGQLGDSQLAWLDEQLGRRTDRPALVCLHHPPMPIGLPSFDRIGLEDGADLAAVISRHPQVLRVLAGHAHRPVFAAFAGTTLALAPSTYRQSALTLRDTNSFGYLDEPTAFLLHWVSDSSCVSHVVAVSHAGALIGGF
jgi:Icc protein